MPELQSILEAALYGDDLDAAERFYTEVCGLERIARDPQRHVFFRCGPTVVLFFDPAQTETGVRRVGGGWSIYFRDPAGNSLEFATARLWGMDA